MAVAVELVTASLKNATVYSSTLLSLIYMYIYSCMMITNLPILSLFTLLQIP